MIIINDRGEERVFNVGQAMCGEGIVEIKSITFEDVKNSHFHEWFLEDVLTRFMSK